MTTTTETTTQATEQGKARRKTRTATINNQGVLTLTVEGKEYNYWLDRIPSDYGMAFELRKFVAEVGDGPASYQICIDTDRRGRADVCECKGYLRWGKCKHLSSIRAIIAAGRLPKYLHR